MLLSSQSRNSASHVVIRRVRLLVTAPVDCWLLFDCVPAGPARRTATSWNTVRTTGLPGLWPKAEVLIVASMLIRSPFWM